MSLLQDVLRTQTLESLDRALASGRNSPDDDDELINVVSITFRTKSCSGRDASAHTLFLPLQMSLPGSPGRSRPTSRPASRPHSPTRGGVARPSPLQPLSGIKGPARDPLRAFPTDISQRIFSLLSIKELARCSRVSKKWNKSQTINYGTWNRRIHLIFVV